MTKPMDIYTPKGVKIKYDFPNNGLDVDRSLARKYLHKGRIYTVNFINVYRSSSIVYLKEVPGIGFNTCLFANVDPLVAILREVEKNEEDKANPADPS